MGLIRATSLVVGIIVGASIFVQPSEVSRHVSSIPAMFAVWLGAGVMSLAGALVCAELAAAFPKTGGIYVYLKETMSPQVAFLWGWAMFWSAHSGIIAAVSVVFARYVGYFAPLGDRGTRAVAISAILTLSAINYIGVRAGSTVQTAFTAAKLLAIGAILVAVVVMVPGHHPAALSSAATQPSIREFLLGISAGLFTFGGWHMVTYAAGETRDPEKTIPRALLIGMLIVTVCYLALNAAYLRVLPLETVLKSTRVAARCSAGGRRPKRRRNRFGPGDRIRLRRAERKRSGRPESLLRRRAGRTGVSGHGRGASALSHAAHRDSGAGAVGLSAGCNGDIPHAVHSRHLHGISVFRVGGARAATDAPAFKAGAAAVSSRLRAGGDQPDLCRSKGKFDRAAAGGRRSASLLFPEKAEQNCQLLIFTIITIRRLI